jgi:3-oxoacyl-[acyl-carrier-protein] synthase-3
MGLSTLHRVRYRGMATCVPKHTIDNLACEPARRLERERLVRNVGIFQRRSCPEWQCFSDLAFDAAEGLLAALNWDRGEIDALIVVTQSPDYPIPSTAIILQDRLGLSQATIAFDVNLGCSAYPYALHLLGAMIAAGAVKKGLVLVGDRSSPVREPLFSDAATATALEFDPDAPPMYFDLNSDGSGYRAIILPVGGHREPVGVQHLIPYRDEHGVWHKPTELQLDGTAVLTFSTQRIPPAVKRLLEYAGSPSEAVDYFVFHQANRMINETIRKKLGLPPERVPSSLHDFGNTSGASIPVTMTVRVRESLSAGRHRLVLCGFGVGLSWGTALVEVEQGVFPPLIES